MYVDRPCILLDEVQLYIVGNSVAYGMLPLSPFRRKKRVLLNSKQLKCPEVYPKMVGYAPPAKKKTTNVQAADKESICVVAFFFKFGPIGFLVLPEALGEGLYFFARPTAFPLSTTRLLLVSLLLTITTYYHTTISITTTTTITYN